MLHCQHDHVASIAENVHCFIVITGHYVLPVHCKEGYVKHLAFEW
jgi:hypothetical protein